MCSLSILYILHIHLKNGDYYIFDMQIKKYSLQYIWLIFASRFGRYMTRKNEYRECWSCAIAVSTTHDVRSSLSSTVKTPLCRPRHPPDRQPSLPACACLRSQPAALHLRQRRSCSGAAAAAASFLHSPALSMVKSWTGL